MELTPRLGIIADSIERCGTLADIGSDHAKLPIYLVKNEKVQKAIASDVNKGPVEIATKRVKGDRVGAAVEIRHGNGLEVLKPGEADVIVIAGMGGILITEILARGVETAWSAGMLILQPMRDSDKVREWLCSNRFNIVDEELVKEDYKIYEIIWAKPQEGSQQTALKPDCNDLYIGKHIIEKKHPLAIELITKRIKEYENVIAALGGNDTSNTRERLKECQSMLEYYNNLVKLLR